MGQDHWMFQNVYWVEPLQESFLTGQDTEPLSDTPHSSNLHIQVLSVCTVNGHFHLCWRGHISHIRESRHWCHRRGTSTKWQCLEEMNTDCSDCIQYQSFLIITKQRFVVPFCICVSESIVYNEYTEDQRRTFHNNPECLLPCPKISNGKERIGLWSGYQD